MTPVGFLQRLGFARPDQAALELALSGPTFAVDEDSIDPAVFGISSYASPTAPAPRVDRRSAMQVPAVKRVRDLIAGSIGQLPVELFDPRRDKSASALFTQPEVGVPRSVTMTRLVEDMLFEQVAWWRVTQFGWHSYPVSVQRMDPRQVTVNDDTRCPTGKPGCSGAITFKAKHVHDDEVIRFESPNDGLLTVGARAIRTCLALDAAAYRYADGAPPLDYFTPDGIDPTDDEVTAALEAWGNARRTRSTGFVPSGLNYNIAGWSPEQLQLAAARQHAVLEIARLGGVDPEELGVSTTSRTYANVFDRRKQFIDFTLGDYLVAIQERLSMTDVTPTGYTARFNLGAFLRSDDMTRYSTYEVGLRVGAISQDEVREAEEKAPLTTNPQESTVAAHRPQAAAFDTTPEMRLDANGAAVFEVDVEKRVIRGLAVPYGKPARSGGKLWQFSKGTLRYADVSRVKLWVQHDQAQAVGVAFELDDR